MSAVEGRDCERLLAGRIVHPVADVAAEPALADLTWPARIGIDAYLGVPISTSTRMYLVVEALRRLDSRSHSSA